MDVPTLESSYWIGAAALLGFALLFNVLFTVALAYLEAPGKPQAIISKEDAAASQRHSVEIQQIKPTVNANGTSNKGMVLPFTPLDMSFSNTNYFVDIPGELKEEGVKENRLQLLQDVTTTFTPGVLTALMGVSGAGNTTLMDVDASFSMVSSRLRNPQVTNGSSLKELRGRIYSLAKDQNGCILLQAKFENPTNEEI